MQNQKILSLIRSSDSLIYFSKFKNCFLLIFYGNLCFDNR